MNAIERFRVIATLGTGATGTVYRAHDPQLGRDVAVKLMRAPHQPALAEVSERRTLDLRGGDGAPTGSLLDEARMMARLSHPNVVAVYEVGVHGGAMFVVMELVDGTDLRRWLATPRAAADVLDVFAQAGRGLAAAHAHHVVHRDFKPDNVLIARDGRVRVADFGLSRLAGPARSALRDADVRGTPRYMAPELWAGRPAGAPADVYALCMAVAEAFGVDGRGDDAPAQLRATRLAPAVRAAIAAGLAADPAQRPSIEAVVAAFEARAPAPRRWLWLGAAVAVAAGGTALAFAGEPVAPAPTCRPDGWLDRALAPALRDAVRDRLAALGGDPQAVLAELDATKRGLAGARDRVCAARARGALTARTAAQQLSCVTRRALELDATARGIAEHSEARAELRAPFITFDSCAALDAPPIVDRARAAELYRWFVRLDPRRGEPALAEADKVISEAARLGERELACRGELARAIALRGVDRRDDAAAGFERARSCAVAITSARIAARALAEHTMTEISAARFERAAALAKLALEHVADPALSPRDRVAIYLALGHSQVTGGDYTGALDTLGKGIAIADATPQPIGDPDIRIRLELAHAMHRLRGRERETLELALGAHARALAELGPRARATATAAIMVSQAYADLNERARAVGYAEQAVDILTGLLPASHSSLLNARAGRAIALHAAGRFADAHAELSATLALQRKAWINLSIHRARFAWIAFETGRFDDGLDLLGQAIEQLTSDRGLVNPVTLSYRGIHAELLIESGRLDDAARQLARFDELRRKRGTADDLRELRATGAPLHARLLRARGRPGEAEPLLRGALAELAEMGGRPDELLWPSQLLAAVLADLGRHDDAERVARELLAEARARNERADVLAIIELALARAELGLGRRDDARARAGRVAGVLADYPGRRLARAEAARLVARLARSGS